MPWQQIADRAIYETFAGNDAHETKILMEFTGLSQNPGIEYKKKLIDLYAYKYKNQTIDLIFTVDIAATQFLNDYNEELFPGVPSVFISDSEQLKNVSLKSNKTGVATEINIKGTIDIALELQPDTRRIAVISGTSAMDLLYLTKVRHALKSYEDRLAFIDMAGLPMKDILERVARLPDHTVVLYVLTLMDGNGEAFIPRNILKSISEGSNAPVYGLWDTFLGYGIVGGYLSSAEYAGREAATMGLRILNGTNPADIPVSTGAHAQLFDWRELERWGLSEYKLRRGSEVRFKEITFFEAYKWYIVFFAALALLEGVLILVLLVQRANPRLRNKP
jgi:ABC-type uncharacterized transport system substrate-binding protein